MSTAREHDLLDQPAGSPLTGEPVFLAVGRLRRPHGLRGDLVMEVLTDFPERLKSGVTVYVGEAYQPLRIRRCRRHPPVLLLAFDGYSDNEQVGELRNRMVFVRADDCPPLPEGEYYHHQILGMQVITDEGRELGAVVQILETGANDVYIIRPEAGPEILLPAIDDVILEINLALQQMRVHLLPGLLPD